MSMNVIGETVKAWLLSLAALLAPSTVFVVTNTCLVLPWLGFGFDTTPLSAANILLILIASLMLHAFNLPLIRFFEGYVRMPSGLDKFLRQRQLAQHMDLMKRQARHLDYDLFVDFPTRPERVLPTRFGNVMAAIEEYPYRCYGIDTDIMWPRLVPLLKETGHYNAIVQGKANFGFSA